MFAPAIICVGNADAQDRAGGAADWIVTSEPARPQFSYETWVGADAAGKAWSVYSGLAAAPFGDIRTDGLRLRSSMAYGQYAYKQHKTMADFRGTMTTADLLVGYQKQFGAVIVKGFVGGSAEQHEIVASGARLLAIDTENAVQGGRISIKAALETWISFGNTGFLQTDINWSEAFSAYGGRLRAGYRINPAFSTGLELAAHGNINHDAGRAGAFLRFEWTQGEISASAGVAGNQNEITGPYGSISALFRF